jgi:hypothetical protein
LRLTFCLAAGTIVFIGFLTYAIWCLALRGSPLVLLFPVVGLASIEVARRARSHRR